MFKIKVKNGKKNFTQVKIIYNIRKICEPFLFKKKNNKKTIQIYSSLVNNKSKLKLVNH